MTMKKTKIICTMGPNTNDAGLMRRLVQNGMDIARFNFSHGDHEEQKSRMDMLKKIREEEKKPIAILLDTKGPEIRTGVLKGGKKVTLNAGDKFVLTTKEIDGDAAGVSITYGGLVEDVQIGKKILIDDGLIELTVREKTDTDIICTVDNGGELGERKGVNVPNVPIRLPAITQKDKEDIKFGVEQEVDFIAASFVRNAECILEIRAWLKECGSPYIPIIAKIENAEGIKNIEEIIRCADGVMVARGDLGVEIPAEEVPYLQKMLIQKCNDYYKPVITATQMLDSMIRNPRPTRAEVTDVANAVYDGTDAVMLSGETAQGKYPLEALQMMVHIVENTEEHLDYEVILEKAAEHKRKGISSAIGYASVAAADNLGAKCIVTPSVSGATARVVSKFKPKADIIGVTPNESTLRRMQIYWGVRPYKSIEFNTTEDILTGAIELISAKQVVEPGDIIVLTAGIPSPNIKRSKEGVSNMMRIAVID
ncbi:pyruvate kinase [[Clostridium] hylemonae DSM 15053]|uniref:Pyruvate kinase n=2 Tax=[Clostridium] hylemonae TaxID=89153 RepID=C0C3Y4_9FIRM|nr:pyruvate kinase [[Clostridium] hylemonae DSM 15053]